MTSLARIVAPVAPKVLLGAAMIAAVVSVSSRAAHAQQPYVKIDSFSAEYVRGGRDTIYFASSANWDGGGYQSYHAVTWKCDYSSYSRPAPPTTRVSVAAGSSTNQSPTTNDSSTVYFFGTAQGTASKPSSLYNTANYRYYGLIELQDLQGTPVNPIGLSEETATFNSLSILP